MDFQNKQAGNPGFLPDYVIHPYLMDIPRQPWQCGLQAEPVIIIFVQLLFNLRPIGLLYKLMSVHLRFFEYIKSDVPSKTQF